MEHSAQLKWDLIKRLIFKIRFYLLDIMFSLNYVADKWPATHLSRQWLHFGHVYWGLLRFILVSYPC